MNVETENVRSIGSTCIRAPLKRESLIKYLTSAIVCTFLVNFNGQPHELLRYNSMHSLDYSGTCHVIQ